MTHGTLELLVCPVSFDVNSSAVIKIGSPCKSYTELYTFMLFVCFRQDKPPAEEPESDGAEGGVYSSCPRRPASTRPHQVSLVHPQCLVSTGRSQRRRLRRQLWERTTERDRLYQHVETIAGYGAGFKLLAKHCQSQLVQYFRLVQ